MQPLKQLTSWLEENASQTNYLFTAASLRAVLPDLSDGAFKALLSRAARQGVLTRICRGIYAAEKLMTFDGKLLFYVANILRAQNFNYLSLETVLAENGVISQIPVARIFVMTSGRGGIVSCGKYGSIEFTHTNKAPADLLPKLMYDPDYRMWRASVPLALQDMNQTKRSTRDLIDWETAREFI